MLHTKRFTTFWIALPNFYSRLGCHQFTKLYLCLVFAVFFIAAYCKFSSSQEPTEDDVAKRHFELFSRSAAELQVKAVGTKDFFRLRDVPLQKFTASPQVYGTVFAWTDEDDRLALVGTFGSLPIGGNEVEFIELHLIKPQAIEPLTVKGFPNKNWSPEVLSLKPVAMTSESEIGINPAKRLIEMRSLIRDFRAEQRHEGKTDQLRLLPQPLYRMPNSSPQKDEALFAFVGETGTDPEVLVRIVLLENNRLLQWHYQAIRFNWREQVLFHKDKEVWKVAEFVSRDAREQTTPYVTGLVKPLQ